MSFSTLNLSQFANLGLSQWADLPLNGDSPPPAPEPAPPYSTNWSAYEAAAGYMMMRGKEVLDVVTLLGTNRSVTHVIAVDVYGKPVARGNKTRGVSFIAFKPV